MPNPGHPTPDLKGLIFGYWEVQERTEPPSTIKNYSSMVCAWWLAKCTFRGCGKTQKLRTSSLKSGRSKSCGCWARYKASKGSIRRRSADLFDPLLFKTHIMPEIEAARAEMATAAPYKPPGPLSWEPLTLVY